MSTPAPFAVSTERLEQRLFELTAARARLDDEIDVVIARLTERGVDHTSIPRPLTVPTAQELRDRALDALAWRSEVRR